MAQWKNSLQPLKIPELHIYDRDLPPPKTSPHARDANEFDAKDNCYALLTSKRETENYVHPQAIATAYEMNNIELTLPKLFKDFDDVPFLTAKACYEATSDTPWADLPENNQKKKISNAKRIVNGEALKHMTVDLLKSCGGFEDIKMWFSKIDEILRSDDITRH